jgi:hypothetical protein
LVVPELGARLEGACNNVAEGDLLDALPVLDDRSGGGDAGIDQRPESLA